MPGLSAYEMIGAKSVMLILETGTSYVAELKVGAYPIELELLTGTGNENPVAAHRFKDLDLPADTLVRLTISANGDIEMRADLDNNGSFETFLAPTSSLSGNAATDTEPPTVHIDAVAGEGNIATININSDDTASGVYKTWFSLNGVEFDQYTGPFQIPVASNPVTIEAFADDNAANRSGLVRRTISLSPTVVPVAECISVGPEGYTARFGYHNPTGSEVSIPVGGDNHLVPFPGNKGQPIIFAIGRVKSVFGVPMLSKTLRWKLRSRDGIIHTAIASVSSLPACKEPKQLN